MALSRRNFLEVSSLSATGLVLKSVSPTLKAFGEALPWDQAPRPLDLGHELNGRLAFSFDDDWQFFRPLQDSTATSPHADSKNNLTLPPNVEWEPATLPHSVRLEPRDVSGGRNYQGVCWYQKRFQL